MAEAPRSVGRVLALLLMCLCSFGGAFGGVVFCDSMKARAFKESLEERQRTDQWWAEEERRQLRDMRLKRMGE